MCEEFRVSGLGETAIHVAMLISFATEEALTACQQAEAIGLDTAPAEASMKPLG